MSLPKRRGEAGAKAGGGAKHETDLGTVGRYVRDRLERQGPRDEWIGIVAEERPAAEEQRRCRGGGGASEARPPERSCAWAWSDGKNECGGARRRCEARAFARR